MGVNFMSSEKYKGWIDPVQAAYWELIYEEFLAHQKQLEGKKNV
jgi:hypothetical protein